MSNNEDCILHSSYKETLKELMRDEIQELDTLSLDSSYKERLDKSTLTQLSIFLNTLNQTGIFLILENKHAILQNYTKDFLNNEEHRKELTTNGKIALLSAVWFWNDRKCSPNTKKYPELLMFKGKHLYEITNDETNGNVATTKENVKTIKSVLAISVSVNGGTNGLSDRAKQHTRIKSQNIFKDF